jgi:hypothetical protein
MISLPVSYETRHKHNLELRPYNSNLSAKNNTIHLSPCSVSTSIPARIRHHLTASAAFNTTATLHHVTTLPSGTTFDATIALLQNHDLLIKLDPEHASYETLPPAPSDSPNTKRYKVTDHMHALPKGLWDSTVTFESHITNLDDGVEWFVKAPLGLVQKTTWRLVRSEDVGKGKETVWEGEGKEGEWCLVEDAEIRASRLLVGTVKGKCESNWRGIHERFIGHLQGVPVKA